MQLQNIIEFKGDNKFLTIVLDILLIFGAGSTLLFFANVIRKENQKLMMYVSFIVVFSTIINIMHIHRHVTKNNRGSTSYNAVMYINVYVIVLMLIISYMTGHVY